MDLRNNNNEVLPQTHSNSKEEPESIEDETPNQRTKRSNSIASGNIPRIRLFLAPQEPDSTTTNDKTGHPPQEIGNNCNRNESRRSHLLDTDYKRQTAKNIKILLEKRQKVKDNRRNSLPDSDSLRKATIKIHFLNGSRRISQVSSAVTQQIQSTIGWKVYINEEEIQEQARKLAAKFVWFKLRKSGFCHKRFHLQRLRSVGHLHDPEGESVNRTLNRVFFEIRALTNQIEASHPKVFSSVLNNVGPTAFKSLQAVTKTQSLIGECLFAGDITWTHVAAFFSITAALCVDSVRSGHHDFVLPLVDSFSRLVSKDLTPWISQEGGWVRRASRL
jgi:hypothetical protein